MEELELIVPTKEHEEKAKEYIREFEEHNSRANGSGRLDQMVDDYDTWLDKLKENLEIEASHLKVPGSTYFLVRKNDNKIIGMTNIRHCLNEQLMKIGGHIGYSIRPTERNKGYGNIILKMGIDKIKELGITKILVTCNKDNPASRNIILHNKGVLENETVEEDGNIIQRYWITIG